MSVHKWIAGLQSDTPVLEAAARVLKLRFKTVAHFLPLAANEPEKDVEYVHQLRVSSRRAVAALAMFTDLMPKKRLRPLRKQLRKIRRAAGNARDWDVVQIHLRDWSKQRPKSEQAGIQFLQGLSFDRRLQSQKTLVELADASLDVQDAIDHLDLGSEYSKNRTLGEHAVPFLDGLQDVLHAAIETDTGDYEHLHRIRIAGKELRYAMEIGAPCFQPPFKEVLYKAIEEMQEILGTANDSHVAVQWLSALRDELKKYQPAEWRAVRPGIDQLLQYHRRRLPAQRRQFAAWLKRWRKQHQRFSDLALAPASLAITERTHS